MIYPTISQAIDTSAFVAVALPTGHNCSSFSLWTEDAAAYLISSVSDGADAITVPASLPLTISQPYGKDSVLCYAKGTSATNLVGLITK